MANSTNNPTARRWLGVLFPVLFLIGLMWLIEIIDAVSPLEPDQYGIQSRSLAGILGIVFAPLLHADFAHLMANSIPFLILGGLVAWRSRGAFWIVTVTIVVLGGFGVWLLGPSNVITIGASGLVFGYLTFLITWGIATRHWLDLTIGVAVLLIYGSLIWGVVPFGVPEGVSWLAHLTGALAGAATAIFLARSEPARAIENT